MGQTCILWKRNSRILGFKKPKDALQQHVKPKYKTTLSKVLEKKVDPNSGSTFFSETISYNDGKQVMIYEPGLYSLAMHSRLPRAEIFQDKIYEVILPELRKYGQVSLQNELTRSMSLLAIKDTELEQERQRADEAHMKLRSEAKRHKEQIKRH